MGFLLEEFVQLESRPESASAIGKRLKFDGIKSSKDGGCGRTSRLNVLPYQKCEDDHYCGAEGRHNVDEVTFH